MSDNDTNKSPTETPRGFGEYRSKTKPLRWRTGPVPVDANGIGMEVYFELRDGRGHGLGTGEKKGGVWEGDWHLRKESILRWLPLSEILALVEEE